MFAKLVSVLIYWPVSLLRIRKKSNQMFYLRKTNYKLVNGSQWSCVKIPWSTISAVKAC